MSKLLGVIWIEDHLFYADGVAVPGEGAAATICWPRRPSTFSTPASSSRMTPRSRSISAADGAASDLLHRDALFDGPATEPLLLVIAQAQGHRHGAMVSV